MHCLIVASNVLFVLSNVFLLIELQMEHIIAETLGEFLNLGGVSAKEAAEDADTEDAVKVKRGKEVKGTVHSL